MYYNSIFSSIEWNLFAQHLYIHSLLAACNYNLVIVRIVHPVCLQDPAVTRRAMDIYKFMNSKVLFKYLRHDQSKMDSTKPVMIHVNYHPNKFERMKAIVEYYVNGNKDALKRFPDGSE
jgi:hypothetical protein